MHYYKFIKFLILFVILGIGCSELIFSIGYSEELKNQQSPLIFQPDSLFGYNHIPNSEKYISKPGIRKRFVKINSKGYYTPEFSTDYGRCHSQEKDHHELGRQDGDKPTLGQISIWLGNP